MVRRVSKTRPNANYLIGYLELAGPCTRASESFILDRPILVFETAAKDVTPSLILCFRWT